MSTVVRYGIIVSVLLGASTIWTSIGAQVRAESEAPPLYTNLGSYHRQVSTKAPLAQRYVDQGFRFLYAFNYREAARAYQQAARLDPGCAMAWWGIAAANGPHINDPTVSQDHARAAVDALQKAQQAAITATPIEQALIRAARKRYADPAPADRQPLDLAYAEAMRQVWREFPRDADVGALFAEAMMDLRPWNQWTPEEKPQPGTEEILTTLETVLKLDVKHPLGNHLTIHAWEASSHPEKAAAAANVLRTLQPGIAHMVHMPSHIDVLRGHWKEAILANERAVAADRAFLRTHSIQGLYGMYMGHNYHMLAYAAMMCGESKRALKAIDELAERLPEAWRKENAVLLDGTGFLAMPLEVRMRFGLWDQVLAAPELAEYLPVTRALRHYARGVAYAARKQFKEAHEEQALFDTAQKRIAPDTEYGLGTARDILTLAGHVLAGEILYQMGKREEGLVELRQAVVCEDTLHYDEPPDWIQPTRHALGAALMTAGRFAEAETVYREDLRKRPENGWGLYGLMRSLDRQGKQEEARQVRIRFDRTWKGSDISLSSSCLCLPGI